MSRTYEYRSGLASQISAFIAEKRACGCKYEKEAKTFQTLDRFLVEQGINTPVLPELVVEKWIEKPDVYPSRYRYDRNFRSRLSSQRTVLFAWPLSVSRYAETCELLSSSSFVIPAF